MRMETSSAGRGNKDRGRNFRQVVEDLIAITRYANAVRQVVSCSLNQPYQGGGS
jgi:hypothetical protein